MSDRPLSLRLRVVLGAIATAAVLALHAMGPEPMLVSAPAGDEHGGCQEDQSCWDCTTMGNRVCGPVPVVTEPGFTG